jgi:hypothetical protein
VFCLYGKACHQNTLPKLNAEKIFSFWNLSCRFWPSLLKITQWNFTVLSHSLPEISFYSYASHTWAVSHLYHLHFMCTSSTIKISIYHLPYGCNITFKIHNLQANVFWNVLKKQIWTSILVTVINESKWGTNKIPVARSLFYHISGSYNSEVALVSF